MFRLKTTHKATIEIEEIKIFQYPYIRVYIDNNDAQNEDADVELILDKPELLPIIKELLMYISEEDKQKLKNIINEKTI
jgi:hypothetical protein